MTVLKRHPVNRHSISQRFANESDRGIHLGIDYRPDYPGQTNFPVYAAHDGFVVFARGTAHTAGNPWEQIPGNGNNGNSVIIQAVAPHQACATSYNHLGTIAVREGQWVTAGTFLGYMGWTGFVLPPNPAGTHLHFELFIDYGNGQYPAGTSYGRVNPLDYFAIETTIPVAPGASGGASTKEDDDMPYKDWPKADKEALVGDIVKGILNYRMADPKHLDEPRRVRDFLTDPARNVWHETTVDRGGKEIPALQELADARTDAGKAAQ